MKRRVREREEEKKRRGSIGRSYRGKRRVRERRYRGKKKERV